MKRGTVSEQQADTDLIKQVLGGEVYAFEMLIRRYNPVLYKTGRSWNYSHEDTQDLMQDTFLDVYTALSSFENRSSFKTWIVKIMLNNCYRKRLKFSYKNEIPLEITDKSTPMFSDSKTPDPGKLLLNTELSTVLEDALRRVPHDYRMVFSLREITGFNGRETAEALQISETNVKVRLTRAKAMLRREIEKSYSPAEIFEFNLVFCDRMVDRVMGKIREGI